MSLAFGIGPHPEYHLFVRNTDNAAAGFPDARFREVKLTGGLRPKAGAQVFSP